MKARLCRFQRSAATHIPLLAIAVFAIGPLAVLVFNAVKPFAEFASNPLGPPSEIALGNIPEAWRQGDFAVTLPNSFKLVALTVGGIIPLAGMAAYALSRRSVRGSSALTVYLLLASTLPLQLFLVPLFYLWTQAGLVNTLPGVAIIYIGVYSPFVIFLLRSYMLNIPVDFEEAAKLDGAGEWKIFWRIIVPLSWPGLLAAGLIVAIFVWQEYLLATIFLLVPEQYTVVTSFNRFTVQYSTDRTLQSAAALITILPLVVIFLSLQRRFVAGFTRGGLGGA